MAVLKASNTLCNFGLSQTKDSNLAIPLVLALQRCHTMRQVWMTVHAKDSLLQISDSFRNWGDHVTV